MAKADIRADLDLDSTGFRKGIQRAKNGIREFADSSIGKITQLAGAWAGINLVKDIIGLGVASAETASKFEAVFGPATDSMNQRIEEMQTSIASSKQEMQEALSTFGAMAQAMGMTDEVAQEFSVNMVKIAGDMASFHNLRPEEAFLKIRSAISGEFEPLKQLGILLTADTVKQEALNMGIWDGVGALNSSQKAMAVQSLILQQMGVALGDASATSDSASNQIKFLIAELKDLGSEMGETTLPTIVAFVEAIATLIGWLKGASEAVGGFFGRLSVLFDQKGFFGGLREVFSMNIDELAEFVDTTEDLNAKIERSAKDATDAIADPARKKAQEDYLESLARQAEMAGDLNDVLEENNEIVKDKEPIKTVEKQTKAIKDQAKAVESLSDSIEDMESSRKEFKEVSKADASKKRGAGAVQPSGTKASELPPEAITELARMFPDRFLPPIFGRVGGANAQGNQGTDGVFEQMRDSLQTIEKEMTA